MTQADIRARLRELRDLDRAEQAIRSGTTSDPAWAVVLVAIDQWRAFITGALKLQDPLVLDSAYELEAAHKHAAAPREPATPGPCSDVWTSALLEPVDVMRVH